MAKKGVISGKSGGVEVFHHSVSSSVRVVKTYKREVEQGVVETVVEEDWYDYAEVADLYRALAQSKEANLKFLLNES
jgi:hypothetical protein